ncbi:MAG: hypothetical protein J6N68_07440 [Shewanella sp.]|nr:hypothetical protein [Shewanella sp.]
MTLTDGYIVIGVAYAIMSTWLIIRKDEETEEEKREFKDLMKSVPSPMQIPAAFLMTVIAVFMIAIAVVGWPALALWDGYVHLRQDNKPS